MADNDTKLQNSDKLHKTRCLNCVVCMVKRPQIRRAATGELYCRDCFFEAFEMEVHHTITTKQLFKRGDRVAIGISGGKDSTVLAHLMTTLNKRYDYGLDLVLLAVDEGISGYRDDSLETVKRNEIQFGIPLKIVSYKELYGWRMDDIVATIGKKNNCTYCGVFRRQALDRGAELIKANKICTGHNADDTAETVLMNLFRGDLGRFSRCSDIITGKEEDSALPRCKPLMFTYEKEIVLYAHFKHLDYFSTECTYSPEAYRGHARELVKLLELSNPQFITGILMSVSQLRPNNQQHMSIPGRCQRCGWLSSNTLCKACVLLESLNLKDPKLGTANKSVRAKLLADHDAKQRRVPLELQYG